MAEAGGIKSVKDFMEFPCPMCGGRVWRRLGELKNLLIHLQSATTEGVAVEVPGEKGGVLAFPFICETCGFIRLHATQVVFERAAETGELDETP